jgi:hypothetical protein
MRHVLRKLFGGLCLSSTLVLGACASLNAPQITTDYDHSANFAAYKTFAFAEPLGTDRGGYTTIVTARLKESVNNQMTQRGYVYQAQNPDLLVNFFIKIRKEAEYVAPPPMAWGPYGFDGGWYQPWPGYGGFGFAPTVVQYTNGIIKIDLIDARKKQLVWEGVSKSQIDDFKNDTSANKLSLDVSQIFAYYPFAAEPAATPAPLLAPSSVVPKK